MRRTHLVLMLLAYGAAAPTHAQDNTISFDQLRARVIAAHPLLRQAQLYKQAARMQLREARGAFDPKILLNGTTKKLGGYHYYTTVDGKLSVPLRAGINAVGGYERSTGPYADPETQTGGNGLYYSGLEINLGQGLFIDSRRAGVLQGKTQRLVGEALTAQYANKLLFAAAKDYWDWHYDYRTAAYLREGVALAQARFDAIREQVRIGEEAAIDSVEALILLQDRTNQYVTADLEARNGLLRLQTYIWQGSDAYDAAQLDTAIAPALYDAAQKGIPDPESQVQLAVARNPDLQNQRAAIKLLEVDRRLALEMLKPTADIKAQVLSKGGYEQMSLQSGYLQDNYRLGATVGVPLFLRKERGKLAQVNIKLQQARLALQQAERDLDAQARQHINAIRAYASQLERQRLMVANYMRLRDGEAIKFSIGESSLFLVNTRESKLIEAEIKRADMEAKLEKEKAALGALSATLME